MIDFTPLKWRGFVTSILATPFIINCWFVGLIVSDLQVANWKWGYGMFAIIIPVVLLHAIALMTYFDKTVTLADSFSTDKSKKERRAL